MQGNCTCNCFPVLFHPLPYFGPEIESSKISHSKDFFPSTSIILSGNFTPLSMFSLSLVVFLLFDTAELLKSFQTEVVGLAQEPQGW